MARMYRGFYWNEIETHRYNLEQAVFKTYDVKVQKELILFMKELLQLLIQLNEKYHNFVDFYNEIINKKGLTSERIQQFEQFTADESFVGDQCVICMGDIKVGSNMMRLDCDGQHTFCQVCIERWFDNHKTCPICRHAF